MQRREQQSRLIQAMRDMFMLPDLRRRLLFTLGILVVFRFIAHVPLPGINFAALSNLFAQNQLFGMLDLFSGGAMRRFSVAAMGVYPYITSSIIMQLLVPVIPNLQALSRQGEIGQRKINHITHLLTIPLAALQGYGMLVILQGQNVFVVAFEPLTIVTVVASMTAGTMFLVWLGELITERGIGNGISLIIFAGIIAGLPTMLEQSILAASDNPMGLAVFIILAFATLVFIVAFIEAHRRIPVQYARTTFRSGRMYRQSGATYIPLRVNTAGMIPLIFAMAVVTLPATIASYFANPSSPNFANTITHVFDSGAAFPLGLVYWGAYFLLVIGFTFFYTMIIFEQLGLAKRLQEQGGFIPGIRPGKATADYLDRIIRLITFGGALFLGLVAIVPFIAKGITNVSTITVSSMALLIVVGVALDTMKQVEAQLTMRRYEGFLR
jgi:preprotein translocase subunit SecY